MKISKDELLSRLDIESYYKEYITSKITKNGNSWCNCRCPLDHDDKTPSFGFNKDNGNFHCFGCDRKGDIFRFEQLKNGGTYNEVVSRFAKRVGLTTLKERSLDQKVEKYHHNLLSNLDNSLINIEQLGISRQIVISLKLGYMPQFGEHIPRFIFPIFDIYGNIITLQRFTIERSPKFAIIG